MRSAPTSLEEACVVEGEGGASGLASTLSSPDVGLFPQIDDIKAELRQYDTPIQRVGHLTENYMGKSLDPKTAKFVQRVTQMYVQELSDRDDLTGLYNKGKLKRDLRNAMNDSYRRGAPLAFFMIDVNGFKEHNDTYGHEASDEKLCDLSEAMNSTIRAGTDLYRYGGDEFGVRSLNTTREQASVMKKRLKKAAETTGLNVSVGFVMYEPGENVTTLIRRADEGMYSDKRS